MILWVYSHEAMANDDLNQATPIACIERDTREDCLAEFNARYDTNDYSVSFTEG